MGRKQIRLKRGLKKDLPVLAYGEPAFVADENALYIGTEQGNIVIGGGSAESTPAIVNNNLLLNSNFHRGLTGFDVTPALLDNNTTEDTNFDNTLVLTEAGVIPQKTKPYKGNSYLTSESFNMIKPLYLYSGKDVTDISISSDFTTLVSGEATISVAVHADSEGALSGNNKIELGYSYISDGNRLYDISTVTLDINKDTYVYNVTIPEGATDLKYICNITNNSGAALLIGQPKVELGSYTGYSINENDLYNELVNSITNPNILRNSGLTRMKFKNLPINAIDGFYTAGLREFNVYRYYNSYSGNMGYAYEDKYYNQDESFYLVGTYLADSDLMSGYSSDNTSYAVIDCDDDDTRWILSSYAVHETTIYSDWYDIDPTQKFVTVSADRKFVLDQLEECRYSDFDIDTSDLSTLTTLTFKQLIEKYPKFDCRPMISLGVDFLVNDEIIFCRDIHAVSEDDIKVNINTYSNYLTISYSIIDDTIKRIATTKAIPDNAIKMRFAIVDTPQVFEDGTEFSMGETAATNYKGLYNWNLMRHFKMEYGTINTAYCKNEYDYLTIDDNDVNCNLINNYADDALTSVTVTDGSGHDIVSELMFKPKSEKGHNHLQYEPGNTVAACYSYNNYAKLSCELASYKYADYQATIDGLKDVICKSRSKSEDIEFILSFIGTTPFKFPRNEFMGPQPNNVIDIENLAFGNFTIKIQEKKSYKLDYTLFKNTTSKKNNWYLNYVIFKIATQELYDRYQSLPNYLSFDIRHYVLSNDSYVTANDSTVSKICNFKLEVPEYDRNYRNEMISSNKPSLPTRAKGSLFSKYANVDSVQMRENQLIDYEHSALAIAGENVNNNLYKIEDNKITCLRTNNTSFNICADLDYTGNSYRYIVFSFDCKDRTSMPDITWNIMQMNNDEYELLNIEHTEYSTHEIFDGKKAIFILDVARKSESVPVLTSESVKHNGLNFNTNIVIKYQSNITNPKIEYVGLDQIAVVYTKFNGFNHIPSCYEINNITDGYVLPAISKQMYTVLEKSSTITLPETNKIFKQNFKPITVYINTNNIVDPIPLSVVSPDSEPIKHRNLITSFEANKLYEIKIDYIYNLGWVVDYSIFE